MENYVYENQLHCSRSCQFDVEIYVSTMYIYMHPHIKLHFIFVTDKSPIDAGNSSDQQNW